MSVCVPICLSVCLCARSSGGEYVGFVMLVPSRALQTIVSSVCMSAYVYVCVSVCLCVRVSVFVCLSVCVCVCLCVRSSGGEYVGFVMSVPSRALQTIVSSVSALCLVFMHYW